MKFCNTALSALVVSSPLLGVFASQKSGLRQRNAIERSLVTSSSSSPSTHPSDVPSDVASSTPSTNPSASPSTHPSDEPSTNPSTSPSSQPTVDNVDLFDLGDGYLKTMTYSVAVTFCIDKGYDGLCSADQYERVVDCSSTYCAVSNIDSWSPISDTENEYLQIGGNCHSMTHNTTGNCYKHSELNGLSLPVWATDSTSYSFRKKVCCTRIASEAPSPSPSSTPSATSSLSPSLSHKPSLSAAPSDAPTAAMLVDLGSDPEGPLGVCTGDCDNDEDCGEGLVCFQRDANEPVPGCIGGENDGSRTDFCVHESASFHPTESPSDSPSSSHTPSSSHNPSPSPSTYPSLAPSLSVAPSLSHKPSSSISPSAMTSAAPTRLTPKELVNLGSDPDGPLGVCTGDCDHDSDCEQGFVCFQRGANEPVPGCIGGENDGSKTDFCVYESATLHPTESPPASSASPTSTPSLSMAPSFSTTSPTLKPSLSVAPSFSNEPSVSARPSTMPNTPAVLVNLGSDPDGPLDVCTGDCDVNSDCAPELVCFQRDANEPVPGCIGGENDGSKTDFCVFESATLHPTESPSDSPIGEPSATPSLSLAPSTYSSSPSSTPSSMPSRPLGELRSYISEQKPQILGLCEGDCDYDSECAPGLFCFHRDAQTPGAVVPGCAGGANDTSRTDFCTYVEFKEP